MTFDQACKLWQIATSGRAEWWKSPPPSNAIPPPTAFGAAIHVFQGIPQDDASVIEVVKFLRGWANDLEQKETA